MSAITDLTSLLRQMQPELQAGDYVFCTIPDPAVVAPQDFVGSFREKEGWTLILEQTKADQLGLPYDFVAAWITLTVHSSLSAVGLTAAFAKALSEGGVSCNVVAAFYHDHIFVNKNDAATAMDLLWALIRNH
jgi:uncharacterized protein